MPSSWQWRMQRTAEQMTTGILREHLQEDGMEYGSLYYPSRSVEVHRTLHACSCILMYICVQVQIVIVARNFFLPLLFRLAELMERFHPRTALKMMLVRYIPGCCACLPAFFHTYTHAECLCSTSPVSMC